MPCAAWKFYHIKNLQSTKTERTLEEMGQRFITLRIYKVLKHDALYSQFSVCFITLRIYKVLKPQQRKNAFANS